MQKQAFINVIKIICQFLTHFVFQSEAWVSDWCIYRTCLLIWCIVCLLNLMQKSKTLYHDKNKPYTRIMQSILCTCFATSILAFKEEEEKNPIEISTWVKTKRRVSSFSPTHKKQVMLSLWIYPHIHYKVYEKNGMPSRASKQAAQRNIKSGLVLLLTVEMFIKAATFDVHIL